MTVSPDFDRILILGLPRTGTQTLLDALKLLGRPVPYHMGDVPENPEHASLWTTLLKRKAAQPTELLSAADFEPILKNFPGGVADFPSAIFGVDLISAYPSARIIITERDEDAWLDSIKRTLVISHKNIEDTRKLAEGSTFTGIEEERYELRKAYHTLCWKDDFDAHGRDYWRNYQAEIRAVAAKERAKDEVLTFDAKQGWEPLCKFLGQPVPSEPFPHVGAGERWGFTPGAQPEGEEPKVFVHYKQS